MSDCRNYLIFGGIYSYIFLITGIIMFMIAGEFSVVALSGLMMFLFSLILLGGFNMVYDRITYTKK